MKQNNKFNHYHFRVNYFIINEAGTGTVTDTGTVKLMQNQKLVDKLIKKPKVDINEACTGFSGPK